MSASLSSLSVTSLTKERESESKLLLQLYSPLENNWPLRKQVSSTTLPSKMQQPSLVERMVSAGAAACVADVITFPFDVAKVRLQIMGEQSTLATLAVGASNGTATLHAVPKFNGLFGTLIHLARSEGPASLYGGISPGLQRQCIFASLRIGIYDNIKEFYQSALALDTNKYSSLIAIRVLSGITSGALAITVAQPTDVVKVKMQAKSGIKYRNSLQAYKMIYRSEGLPGLWKGLGPNVARNATVNAAELVCYDTIKDLLIRRLHFQDNLICHFYSAFGAGFFATVVASPIDVVKTRIMNSSAGQYQGMIDCARKLVAESGVKAFYKGFTPSFMRLGSWNVCMFVTYEQFKKIASEMR